jgi:hypothetical protein
MQFTIPATCKAQTFLINKRGKKTELNFYIFNHSVQLCKLYSIDLIQKHGEMIRYRRWLLAFEVTVIFCLPGTTDEVHYKSNYPLFWLKNEFFVFRIAVQIISIHQQGCCN